MLFLSFCCTQKKWKFEGTRLVRSTLFGVDAVEMLRPYASLYAFSLFLFLELSSLTDRCPSFESSGADKRRKNQIRCP